MCIICDQILIFLNLYESCNNVSLRCWRFPIMQVKCEWIPNCRKNTCRICDICFGFCTLDSYVVDMEIPLEIKKKQYIVLHVFAVD